MSEPLRSIVGIAGLSLLVAMPGTIALVLLLLALWVQAWWRERRPRRSWAERRGVDPYAYRKRVRHAD